MSYSKEIVLVKLGGSVITDKKIPGKIHGDQIDILSGEIAELYRQDRDHLIIFHGGGSFSHPLAEKYQTSQGIQGPHGKEGMIEVLNGGRRLHHLVLEYFYKHKIPAVSLSPISWMNSSKGFLNEFFLSPLINLLEYDLVPVSYGDLITDSQFGYFDTSSDVMVARLAEILYKQGIKPKMVIHVGRTDGVYDHNFRTIPEITFKNIETIKRHIGQPEGIDVTGGMRLKVEQSLLLAGNGIPSLIISGKKGNLINALRGQLVTGTWIK